MVLTDLQPRLLFVRDLRQMFPRLGADTIYALLSSGEIAARKVGNRWVTTPRAVEAWLARIGSGCVSPPTLKVVR